VVAAPAAPFRRGCAAFADTMSVDDANPLPPAVCDLSELLVRKGRTPPPEDSGGRADRRHLSPLDDAVDASQRHKRNADDGPKRRS
jgi:hypothetical protein